MFILFAFDIHSERRWNLGSNAKISLTALVKLLDKIKLCVLKNLSRDLLCALDPDVILIFLVLGYLERMLGLSLVILLAFSDGHWSPSPARRRPQNSLWISGLITDRKRSYSSSNRRCFFSFSFLHSRRHLLCLEALIFA